MAGTTVELELEESKVLPLFVLKKELLNESES